MNRRKSIRMQLMVIGLSALILLIGAFVITDKYIKNTLQENTLHAENKLMLQMEQKFEDYHDALAQVATAMAYSPTIYEYFFQNPRDRVIYQENVSTVFSNTILLDNSILDIFLFDRNMERIASMGKEVQELEKNELLYIPKKKMEYSNCFRLEESNVPYYMVYFPVFNLDSNTYGNQIGTCVLILNTDRLTELLAGSQTTAHTQVYLIDQNSQILAACGDSAEGVLGQEMMESQADCQVNVHSLAMEGWKLVSRIPVKELTEEADISTRFVFLAYLLAILLQIAVIWICYRQLVVPVQEMDRFVQKISKDPQLRMEIKRRDEIGSVQESLNQMLNNIQQQNREIEQAREQAHQAQLAEKQLQILAYRNQINPHFLYNTLDCMRAMALINDQNHIAEMAMALSKVFRYAIKGSSIVCVEDEISYIREYAKIIDYRFGGKIRVTVKMDEKVKKKQMIKLLLQPLIENAVFHGLERTIEGGQVKTVVSMAGEHRIHFLVEDNGCGMSEETLWNLRNSLENRECRKGIGVANIYQRLRLFYEEETEFSIESVEGSGTRIVIEIPDQPKDRGNEYV